MFTNKKEFFGCPRWNPVRLIPGSQFVAMTSEKGLQLNPSTFRRLKILTGVTFGSVLSLSFQWMVARHLESADVACRWKGRKATCGGRLSVFGQCHSVAYD
jgi:hypothetical protein